MEAIYNWFITFWLSFIITTCTFYFVLWGFGGKFLKNWLSNKIAKNDFVWFNKLLIYGAIFYLFVVITANYHTIHLDDIYEVTVGNVKASIPVDYTIKALSEEWRSAALFMAGAHIGAGFVKKYPISIASKIATALISGSATSMTYKLFHGPNNRVPTGSLGGNPLTDNSLSLVAQNVKAYMQTTRFANEITNSTPRLPNNSLISNERELLIKKFLETLNPVSDHVEDSVDIITDNNVTEGVLNTIEQNHLGKAFYDSNKNLGETVVGKPNLIENVDGVTKTNLIENVDGINAASSSSSSSADSFINSPLESTASEILNQTLKADLTEMLSDNLFVNLSIVYLLFILVLVLTIRFVVNHAVILNKIKSFNSPFGKVLYYILSKLVNVWKNASIFWIYFILFTVIWCSFASAYAIYWCLVAISMPN